MPTDQQVAFEELRRKLTPRLRFIPRDVGLTPAQVLFCLQQGKEVFYGGAAGGGKTYALLAAALQYADVPGYAAILFRRTHKELEQPGQLMTVAHDWLDNVPGCKWSETKKRWTFPSGATLHFGYMQDDGDASSHKKGPTYQFIGWDELTEFPDAWYTDMFSRLRRPVEGRGRGSDGLSIQDVPLRMRAASNPGGLGHGWVKHRFVDSETKKPDVVFIPAKISDNPKLDQSSYIEGLQELHALEKARMLDGDWSAAEVGQMFPRTAWQIADYHPGQVVASVRWWDLAATDPKRKTIMVRKKEPDYTVGIRLDRLADNRVVISDVRRFRRGPTEVENAILQTIVEDGPLIPVWLEIEGGSMAIIALDGIKRRVSGLASVNGQPATGSKMERARPLSIAVSNGVVIVLRRRWTSEMLDEYESFPGLHDDQVDAGSGGFSKLPQSPHMASPLTEAIRHAEALAAARAHINANMHDSSQMDVNPLDIVW